MLKLFAVAFLLWGVNYSYAQRSCDIKNWSLDDKIGQLIWIGVKKTEDLKKFKPSGVILFKWNYKNLSQLKSFNEKLNETATRHLKAPLFIGIDHEGGEIDRLGYSLTPFPDAASMGSVQDKELVYEAGKVMGMELRAIGINTNLAPVLDLGDARTFLENRIWGQKPQQVAERTQTFIRGLKDAGIFPVAKHFPGHGGSRTDAHFEMPVVKKSFERLWEEDLKPFKEAIQNDLPALMTAHVEVPSVDRGPASLSRVFLHDVLRGKLGFKGLVITDDLEMGGVLPKSGGLVEEAALKAFQSGTDQLLVVWNDSSKEKILKRIKEALRLKEVTEETLDKKVCHILAIKEEWIHKKQLSMGPSWATQIRKPSSLALAKEITKQALTWIAGPKEKIVSKLNRDWKGTWRIALTLPSEAWYWRKNRPQDQIFILGRRPDEKKKKELKSFLDGASAGQVQLVLTGPRHSIGDEAYQSYLDWLLKKSNVSEARLLWVHKGLNPVKLNQAESIPFGILSLNGGMKINLEAFFEWVLESHGESSEGRVAKSNAKP